MKCRFFPTVFLLFVSLFCRSQSVSLEAMVSARDSIGSVFPREKLFVHRDRGDYFV